MKAKKTGRVSVKGFSTATRLAFLFAALLTSLSFGEGFSIYGGGTSDLGLTAGAILSAGKGPIHFRATGDAYSEQGYQEVSFGYSAGLDLHLSHKVTLAVSHQKIARTEDEYTEGRLVIHILGGPKKGLFKRGYGVR